MSSTWTDPNRYPTEEKPPTKKRGGKRGGKKR